MTLCFIIFFYKKVKVYNKLVTLVSFIALQYPNYKKGKSNPKDRGVL